MFAYSIAAWRCVNTYRAGLLCPCCDNMHASPFHPSQLYLSHRAMLAACSILLISILLLAVIEITWPEYAEKEQVAFWCFEALT